jgi:hypothetical protein
MSDAEKKRSSLSVGEWLWGAVQGSFNDKLSVGQIVFDATLSAFPIAGELTAARDVIAQLIRMCKSPKLWEEVLEWVMLLLPLLAIVPLFGGLLKGVGKLVMRVGKSAAEDKEIFQAIIQLCNRLGHGDAVKFIKELDFAKYQSKLIEGFNDVCKRIDDTLRVISDRLKSVLPKDVLAEFADLRESLAKLKERGSKMIPEGLKQLNAKLKQIQGQLYSGEWHTVTTGTKNTTREVEARLVEQGDKPRPRPKSKGYPQNKFEDYQHVDGWPDLRARKKIDKLGVIHCETIEAFSGAIKARKLTGPKTVYRVFKVGENGKASPWWTETMPKNAQEWREDLAVLDEFNKNSYFIKFEIPAGRELHVWEGHAAEQFDKELGQFLGGGGMQFFIDWPADLKAAIEKLPNMATGWGKTTKKYGYEMATNAKNGATVDKLATGEYAAKKLVTGSK